VSRKVIIVVSGFTEKLENNTGSREIWHKLFERYSDKADVWLFHWKANWRGWATMLEKMEASEVLVCAYSWGAGFGLRELAKHYSGAISCVLCDPVYYSKFWLTKWRAITDKFWRPTIKYSDNVTVKEWFTQIEDQPGNDNVYALNMPKTVTVLKGQDHRSIDNSKEYHDAAIREAEQYLSR
jgi:hypothetical protein